MVDAYEEACFCKKNIYIFIYYDIAYDIAYDIYIYIYMCVCEILHSLKPSKSDEQDIQDTAGEVRMNSLVTFSPGPLHMD